MERVKASPEHRRGSQPQASQEGDLRAAETEGQSTVAGALADRP